MKKFLSLVLALAMAMSLVVINTSAADFTDNEDITYDEAVAVISEIGVVDGYTDGNFNPTNGLTRGAAAKIICNLILGPTTAAELHATTAPYSDVSTSNEFAGYIAYCSQQGIISGYADGTFRPANPLTGYAFMKMLLGALGYDQYTEGYVGDNWSIQVAKQAIGIGLNAGLTTDFDGTAYVTREEACLYAFNMLQSDLVEYDTIINTTINGQTVTIGNSVAQSETWGNSLTRRDNIKNDDYIQFAEQYFNRLVLDNTTDVFGRPARHWDFDGTEIGTYVKYELMTEEYTSEVTGRDLYDLLGRTTIDEYDFLISIDGETSQSVLENYGYFTQGNLVRGNTNTVGNTANGVLTQVFVDNDPDVETVYISIINTYLAKADGDYDDKDDELDLDIYAVDDIDAGSAVTYVKDREAATENATVSGEDFAITDYVDGDIVLVTVADGEVQTIADPEILSDATVTTFRTDETVNTTFRSTVNYVITDGEQYDSASTLKYDAEVLDDYTGNGTVNLKDTTYNLILDPYGYVIGLEQNEDTTQYLFLTGWEDNDSYLGARTAKANVIFLDGTMATVDVDTRRGTAFTDDAILNTWCTYTVNSSEVYTLTEVSKSFDASAGQKAGQAHYYDNYNYTPVETFFDEINDTHVSLPGRDTNANDNAAIVTGTGDFVRVYGNDDSVYISVSLDDLEPISVNNKDYLIIDDVDSVTTGIENADMEVYTNVYVTSSHAAPTMNYATGGVSHGVYALFDDDAYVIGAIVVGEDVGSASNYAYVTSGRLTSETYLGNDEWSFVRQVAINGQLTDITYVGDQLDQIGLTGNRTMVRGNWYEVRYDADGNVRRTNLINSPATFAGYAPTVNGAVTLVENGQDTVLLQTTGATKLTLQGRMLYTDTAQSEGFGVSSDVNVVLVQDTSAGTWDIVEEYTGVDGLEDAIDDMYDNFTGELAAVIEDGRATSIVIHNTNPQPIDGGTDTPSVAGISVDLNASPVTVSYTGSQAPSQDDILVAIEQALVDNGYTVTEKRVNASGNYVFTALNNRTQFEEDFTYVPTDPVRGVANQPASGGTVMQNWMNDSEPSRSEWYKLPTAGLTQTVTGRTVKLSGTVTAITNANWSEYQSAAEQWFGVAAGTYGTYAAFESAIDSICDASITTTDITHIGYVVVKVYDANGGHNNVAAVVGLSDGSVVFAKQGTDSKDYRDVTIDISGLEF